ncbi:MAG: PaaI family thioesterase [Oxalobacter sp.]
MSETFSDFLEPQRKMIADALAGNMHLGMQLLSMKDGKAEIGLLLKPEHLNELHVVDSGVMMIVLDSCMGIAARSTVDAVTSGATVEMKTSVFQHTCKEGQFLTAKASVIYRDEMLYYCEAEIWYGENIIAKTIGTFKVFLREELLNRLKAKGYAYLK